MNYTSPSPFLPAGEELAGLVETEVRTIESSPDFVRAPKIRQLLRFLVQKSLSGESCILKSYSIAVEGLGRDADFDAHSDSYPRVQVARLRKMLDKHYAEHPPNGGMRLSIAPGSYKVDFGIDAREYGHPKSSPVSASIANSTAPLWKPALVVFAAMLLAIAAFAAFSSRQLEPGWSVNNFPRLAVAPVVARDGTAEQIEAATLFADVFVEELTRYRSVRVGDQSLTDPNFAIETSLRSVGEGTEIRVVLIDVHDRDRMILWSRNAVRPRDGERLFDFDDVAERVSAGLVQPAGVLHRHSMAHGIDVRSQYGCWLAYMNYWHGREGANREAVIGCIDRWLKYQPTISDPHAGKAWLLADQAMRMPLADRSPLLEEGWQRAMLAVQLDPGSPNAQYARMHLALQLGDLETMRDASERILEINRNNPSLAVSVGVHRILGGDASAEALLRTGMERHSMPPAWAHLGTYMAAVQRDDPATATTAARAMRTLPNRATHLPLLAAAQARAGNLPAAAKTWVSAVQMNPELAERPSAAFDTFPLAPSVRAKALAWVKLAAAARS